MTGLSPRVRGNLRDHRLALGQFGSIPARAGEPTPFPENASRWRVYPRACGGTGSGCVVGCRLSGLSPRVRGNQGGFASLPACHGSIPARAGEPTEGAKLTWWRWVYPRACGGTVTLRVSLYRFMGLSPRVRGNPGGGGVAGQWPGSIPARAGEPDSSHGANELRRVYPRACGGTRRAIQEKYLDPGLSPRVRGNPEGDPGEVPGPGSIPARAGEPGAPPPCHRRLGVYPRACGGTGTCSPTWHCGQGLSPRVRGNRAPVVSQ